MKNCIFGDFNCLIILKFYMDEPDTTPLLRQTGDFEMLRFTSDGSGPEDSS